MLEDHLLPQDVASNYARKTMSFTRPQIEAMREDQLREEVLVPLFKAMGYRDVYLHHGGALEQGKDIVMWKSADLRPRVNYAVVAKRGAINGQASGAGSAGEVATQVQQCFGKPYLDPVELKSCEVDQCLVVTSGPISTTANNALDSLLKKLDYLSRTVFIDGDRLWELVQKHLAERLVRDQLMQAQKALSSIPGHAVKVSFDKENLHLEVNHIDATAPPAVYLKVNPSELLGHSEEVINLKNFVSVGDPLRLDSKTIGYLEMPEVLRSVLDVASGHAYEMRIWRNDVKPQRIRLLRVCDDGEKADLGTEEFKYIQGGTEEVTFSNEHLHLPWRLVFKSRTATNELKINFSIDLHDVNVKRAVDWLLFQRACSKPGNLILRDTATGFETEMIHDDGIMKAVNPRVLEIGQMLVFIQAKTASLIPFPKSVTPEQGAEIREMFDIIKTGRGRDAHSCTFTMEHPEKWRGSKDDFNRPSEFRVNQLRDTTRELLGIEINLGPMHVFSKSVKMSRKMAKYVRAQLNQAPLGPISIKVTCDKDNEHLYIRYPKWLPDNEKQQLILS